MHNAFVVAQWARECLKIYQCLPKFGSYVRLNDDDVIHSIVNMRYTNLSSALKVCRSW